MEPFTLLAALIPLFTEAGKAAVQRWIAPDVFKPTNAADYVAVRGQDIELFKAMNNIGGTNVSYPWVEAVIKLMRPFVVISVLLTWAFVHAQPALFTDTTAVDNFASCVGFYLFADRTLFYSKKTADK